MKPNITPISKTYATCKESDDKTIDTTKYEVMKMCGNSLDLFNIFNDDMILIKPETLSALSSNNLCLPKTFIFKSSSDVNIENYNYTACRALAIINISSGVQLKNYVFQYINKPCFIKIKKDVRYVNNNYFVDFIINNPVPKNIYSVILIARIDDNGYWIADFIPTSCFYGIAEYKIASSNK